MTRRTHLAIGIGAALLVELLYCLTNERPVRIENLLAAGLGGATGGLLPDLLEPALTPDHRGFFHSYAAAGATSAGLRAIYHDDSTPEWVRAGLRASAVGYLSHLALDLTTPRGLPLVS